jgi:hypothetical protein
MNYTHARTVFPYSKADFNTRPDHNVLAVSVRFQVLDREDPDNLDYGNKKSECKEGGEN